MPDRPERARAGLSLRRQLLLWLLAPQLVLWLAGAATSYQVALRHAYEAIDQSLSRTSRALARQVQPLGSGLLIDFPRAAHRILAEDPQERLFYMVSSPPGKFLFGNAQLEAVPAALAPAGELPRFNQPYFFDSRLNKAGVRVAALYLNVGARDKPMLLLVQVAKELAPREVLAHQILVDTVIPLALLMLATSLFVWSGISRGLRPLKSLQRLVENRSPQDLAPLKLESAPREVHALALALNALLAAVNKNIAVQRRFIADAAHQLRTPLAGLKSQTELAIQESGGGALVERLQRVKGSAERAIHMVNQLLTLARAEPDQEASLLRERVDLTALVKAVALDSVRRAVQRGIDLGLEPDPPNCTVIGNSVLLRELFLNLIDNAILYSPPGSSVTLRLNKEAVSAIAEVEDDGPGIADAEKERVFERFYRGNEAKEGCGLGLPIVREIANRHGARVELKDAIPHGLIVSVRFPLST